MITNTIIPHILTLSIIILTGCVIFFYILFMLNMIFNDKDERVEMLITKSFLFSLFMTEAVGIGGLILMALVLK